VTVNNAVPLLDLQAQYQSIKSAVMEAVSAVFDRQQFVLGQEGEKLEAALAEYCQVKFAIGCASGSDALLLALMAEDIKPGDEVITTPFTFFATGGSIARLGAKPVFVDIDPATFNIDPQQIAALITPRTRAIMPVHLFGQCAEMDAIQAIADRHGLPIIEDAAQAIGSEYRQRRAGSLGKVGCLSFFPTKNLGAAGDAGMLLTNDAALAARLRRLRAHGSQVRYYYDELGCNSRLDELQAAVLRVKLRYLESWTVARQQNAAYYDNLFAEYGLLEKITLPVVLPYCRHTFHQYTVRAAQRDELLAYLKAQRIGAEVYYPLSLHQQRCFADLQQGPFKAAEAAAQTVLSLPIYPELTRAQQQQVVAAIAQFYDKRP
jgi:dTDP-4-amino-4,6-dideoxygalactose transaminase